MKNILLTIEYDGTGFFGWQRQSGVRTVQGELEKVLSKLCACPISINGTGRTDAGVHALGQRASFQGNFGIPTDRLAIAANNLLSGGKRRPGEVGDIRIIKAEEVLPDFHARYDAKGKKYIYRIRSGVSPNIFDRNYIYQIMGALNVGSMREAAKHLVGTHDFKCFQASGGEEKQTTVRTIFRIDIREHEENEIHIEVVGDGFLYNMVRIIAGTLVEVGKGQKQISDMEKIIASKNRSTAGHTAPPQGLYLAEVYYREEDIHV